MRKHTMSFDLTGRFIWYNIMCCGYHNWLEFAVWFVVDLIITVLAKVYVKNIQFMPINLNEKYDRTVEALEIIDAYNELSTDRNVHLFEITRWAIGQREDKPTPEDFGL